MGGIDRSVMELIFARRCPERTRSSRPDSCLARQSMPSLVRRRRVGRRVARRRSSTRSTSAHVSRLHWGDRTSGRPSRRRRRELGSRGKVHPQLENDEIVLRKFTEYSLNQDFVDPSTAFSFTVAAADVSDNLRLAMTPGSEVRLRLVAAGFPRRTRSLGGGGHRCCDGSRPKAQP